MSDETTTTTALAWIRKSKGSDDDIGLELQRDDVLGLAEDIADDVDRLDLGVQTGFSTLTRDDDTGLLDQVPAVTDAVERLREGAYDYVVAFDDRRVARDEYFSVVEHAMVQGDAEFVFVSDDVERDDLAFDIQRRVERKTKEEEIAKSRAAVRSRVENGCWQGRTPYGLQFAADGCHLEKHADEWGVVEDVLERVNEDGESKSSVARDVSASRSTVSRIADRGRRWYTQRLEEYGRVEA